MAQPLSDTSDDMPGLEDEIEEIADDTPDERRPLQPLADDARPLVARRRIVRGPLSGRFLHGEHFPLLRMDLFCGGVFMAVLLCVALGLIFGFYGTKKLQLGPNSSMLIKANRFFVDSIEVVELGEAKGSMLYGFHKKPPLDILVSWSEIHKISLPNGAHKEWMYYLNEGSQMNISYSLNSSRSPSLSFVIVQGEDEFANWLEDPSYSSATLSWKTIQGNGTIQKAVLESSAYYVAVRNLHAKSVEVQLNIRVKAFMFNTTEPYYKCIPAQDRCSFKFFFLGGNVAVLTSPGRQLGIIGGGSNVKISYGLRVITYLITIGGISAPALITYFLNKRGNVEDPCSICLSAPKECVFHPCGHLACSKCATRMAREFQKCHMCRGPISEETIQRLNN